MPVANIQLQLLCLTARKSGLQNNISNIMNQLMLSTRGQTELMDEINEKRAYYNDLIQAGEMAADSPEYQQISDDIQAEFALALSDINNWELQLNMQKNGFETELRTVVTTEESLTKAIKDEIKNGYGYCKGSGG